MKSVLTEKVKNLPKSPGVYIYKNAQGKVIYVGKAKSLKSRVGSYFLKNLDPASKTYTLVQNIAEMDYILAQTEFEAIILEAQLIKKYYPKYNILMKDDKSFLYIVVRNGKVPRIGVLRETDLGTISKRDTIFGPYNDGRNAKQVLRLLRKVFPYCDCSPAKFSRYARLHTPCLYGHLGLCPAPCVGNIDQNKQNSEKIKKILAGKSTALIKTLSRQMKKYSAELEYEKAGSVKDVISKFEYLTQTFHTPQEYVDNPYLVNDLAFQSLEELKLQLPLQLNSLERIECYDISNISGKDSVGSLVVATNGKIDKNEYKKFKIRLKEQPDDFGMLAEVLERRLGHSDWPVPDLIVLDGGKGQLSAVLKVMDTLGVNFPVVGLAKKFETLVYKKENEFFEVRLGKKNKGLQLLMSLRDEAHRFAQKYHHELRKKELYK